MREERETLPIPNRAPRELNVLISLHVAVPSWPQTSDRFFIMTRDRCFSRDVGLGLVQSGRVGSILVEFVDSAESVWSVRLVGVI